MYISILEQALMKMPNYFTSNQFKKQALDLGAELNFVKKYQPIFLKDHCIAGETRRTWYKKSISVTNDAYKRLQPQVKQGLLRRFINWIY